MNVLNDPLFLVILAVFLAACLVLVGVALGGLVLLWWRHIGLVSRVTSMEARNESALTRTELHALHERMATVEGQVIATNRLVETVHEYLLENPR